METKMEATTNVTITRDANELVGLRFERNALRAELAAAWGCVNELRAKFEAVRNGAVEARDEVWSLIIDLTEARNRIAALEAERNAEVAS